MKIDLSVIVDEKILKVMASMASQGEIASVAKFGHIGTHFDVMDKQFSLENTERRGIIFDVRDVKDREIEIVKKLHSLDTPIEKIAEIVELSTEEVKKIIK